MYSVVSLYPPSTLSSSSLLSHTHTTHTHAHTHVHMHIAHVLPHTHTLYIQVASLTLLAQLLPPRLPTVSNPAPDSSLCRAAAPRLRPLQLLLAACIRFESAAAPWPDCVCLDCCSPFVSASSCCSPIAPVSAAAACSLLASTSAAAPRLRPLRLLLPSCVRFDCCSPIACIRLQPQLDSSPMFSNFLREVRGSVNKLKYEGRASL